MLSYGVKMRTRPAIHDAARPQLSVVRRSSHEAEIPRAKTTALDFQRRLEQIASHDFKELRRIISQRVAEE